MSAYAAASRQRKWFTGAEHINFMKKIKSKDIAKALQLSAATVSLALNHKPGVNEETRRRVEEYLAKEETRLYGAKERRAAGG